MSQANFQKQQRERARRERAVAKGARRAERAAASSAEEPPAPPRDQGAVLAELAALHERFEAGQIAFSDFEVAKQQLAEQLDVR